MDKKNWLWTHWKLNFKRSSLPNSSNPWSNKLRIKNLLFSSEERQNTFSTERGQLPGYQLGRGHGLDFSPLAEDKPLFSPVFKVKASAGDQAKGDGTVQSHGFRTQLVRWNWALFPGLILFVFLYSS